MTTPASPPICGDIIERDVRYGASELAQRAADLTAALTAELPPGRVLGVAATSVAAHLIGNVAARDAGCSVAHLSNRTPRRPLDADRFALGIDSAAVNAIVADRSHSKTLTSLGYSTLETADPELSLWQIDRGTSSPPQRLEIDGGSTIVHTSGSTATPKGVVISAAALTSIVSTNQALYDWRPGDVLLNALPPTHLAGLGNLLAASASAVTTVVPPPFSFAGAVAGTIEEWGVTVAGLVPFQLHQLLRSDHRALQQLRLVISSAAPLTSPLVARLREAAPATRLVNAYGLSEAFRSLTAEIRGPDDADLLGWPRPGVQAEVRDTASGEAIGDGVGELYLRGPNVFAGYVGEVRHRGWVPTGDLARRTASGFRLVGRRANLINVGGEKVAAETIEAALSRLSDRPIAVAARLGDDGNDRVVAVAEAATGSADLELEQLVGAGELAPSARPTALVFVDQLPRTVSGKIDRRALQQLVAPEPASF